MPDWQDDEAVADEDEEPLFFRPHDDDLESQRSPRSDARLSRSRSSVEAPLLWRHASENGYIGPQAADSYSQKIYIVTEDLTAVIAGFSTSIPGFAAYLALCVFTGGLAYLLFRWVPKWRVRLIGNPEPLRLCHWAAIEVTVECSVPI